MDKFGKICQHHWKECLKIDKIAKFESDLLKNSEEIAPYFHEISQTFVWGGGGAQNLPPNIQTMENFRNFAELFLGSLKMYHFQI